MKAPNKLLRTFSLGFALCFSVSLMAQDAQILPRPDRITTTAPVAKKSPMNSASMRTEKGYARIVYSQPMLRNRQMLGNQVKFGKVWRAGANEATEIFITSDLNIGDQVLSAGAYSVYIIPDQNNWTIIFNKALGQWGAYNYDDAQDALRIQAPVKTMSNTYEAFTIFFEKNQLVMAWGPARVELPVSF